MAMSWLRRREVFGSSKSRAGDYSRIYTSLYSSIGKQANSQYDYGGIFNLEFSYDGWVFILHFSCARSIPKPEHKQLLFSSSLCCNITLLTRESTPRRKCIWRDSNFKNAISDSMLDIDIGWVHSTQWHRRLYIVPGLIGIEFVCSSLASTFTSCWSLLTEKMFIAHCIKIWF